MKKTYIEPTVEEIRIRLESVMTATSPGQDDTPGSNGLGNEPLGEFDDGLAKEDFFGW